MLDLTALDRYLAVGIGGYRGPLKAKAFSQGQSNPTFLLTTPGARYVLRKKPPGQLLRSAHAVDREFRVQKALAESAVPVPRMRHLCEDPSVLGTAFYVMDYIAGQVFWDPALPELSPDLRGRVYDQMNRVLAAIHNVDISAAGLADFGRPDNYFARQTRRWSEQYRATEAEPIPPMDVLIDWVAANLPEDDGQTSLVHGDYRIDNLIFDPETLTIRAVLDWELSTLGHPLADLAYQVMQRSMGRSWHIPGLAGLDTDALGIPSEQAYVAAYCRRRNLAGLPDWHFAKVFAFFRFAAICHGVGARAAAGNNASPDATRVGAMARPLAELGARLATGT